MGCSAQRWYPTLIGTTSSPRERQEDVLGRKGPLGGPGSAPTSPPLQEQLRTRPRGGVDRCGAVARAATHDEVEGVLLLGSTASGDLTVASDFDVMVVLATGGEGREGLQVEIALIDGRLADILIVSFARLSAAVHGVDETDYRLAAWLTESVIAFDLGDIAGLRTSAASRPAGMVTHDVDEERRQFSYDVLVNENYAKSAEEEYRLALELRSLHAFSRLLLGYFRVRGILWRGEKAAIRYLRVNDPDFLAVVEGWVAGGPDQRLRIHRLAAEKALTPVGGVWAQGRFPSAPGVWNRLMTAPTHGAATTPSDTKTPARGARRVRKRASP